MNEDTKKTFTCSRIMLLHEKVQVKANSEEEAKNIIAMHGDEPDDYDIEITEEPRETCIVDWESFREVANDNDDDTSEIGQIFRQATTHRNRRLP